MSKVFYVLFLMPLFLSSLEAQEERQFFGYNAHTHLESVVLDNGDFALIGSKTSASEASVIVLYFNACSDTLWTREFFKNSPFNSLICSSTDGQNLWLAAALGAAGDSAIGLLKLDHTGQTLLSKSIVNPNKTFRWYKMHFDTQGDINLTGNSNRSGGLSNTILKLSPQGQIIRANQYGSTFIWGMSCPTLDGGLLNLSGPFVYKISRNGAVEWVSHFGRYYQSPIAPIAVPDGYILFSTYIGGIDRTIIFKLDLQGNLVWSTDAYLHTLISDAVVDADGDIHMCFTGFGTSGQVWGRTSLDSSGAHKGSWTLPRLSGDAYWGKDIALLPNGRTLLIGTADFALNSYQSINLKNLPQDLDSLSNCVANVLGFSLEPLGVVPMPNAPSLSPQALIGFQVQNFNFPSHSIVLNENRYCQNSSSNFEFSLGPDTAICRFNSSFLLHADTTDVGFKYLWSDGSTKNELSIDKDGWYWLEISNGCDGHRFRDSVFISTIEPIQGEAIMEPQNPLPGDSISLSVTPSNLQVNWYLGGEVKSGNPLKTIARTVYNSGIIGEFFDTNGCLSYDTLYPNIPDFILNMPNAFSPNGDNLNDFFGPHPDVVFDYQLEIFDRFGKRQAQLDNSPWDGGNCLQGSYTYVMWYRLQPDSELKIVRGYLSLVP